MRLEFVHSHYHTGYEVLCTRYLELRRRDGAMLFTVCVSRPRRNLAGKNCFAKREAIR